MQDQVSAVSFSYSSLMLVSCLAHVINLATQALIGTYSKSPFYDPKAPNQTSEVGQDLRDEVGLVRAISVKVGLVFLNWCIPHFQVGEILCKTQTALPNYSDPS